MGTVGVMFGLFAMIVVSLIAVLLRRRNGATQNADGLLLEQDSRVRARENRVSFSSLTVHNSAPTMTDQYRRR